MLRELLQLRVDGHRHYHSVPILNMGPALYRHRTLLPTVPHIVIAATCTLSPVLSSPCAWRFRSAAPYLGLGSSHTATIGVHSTLF